MRRTWLTVALAALLASCDGGSGGTCTADSDCAGAEICRFGHCRPAPGDCEDADGDGFSAGPSCSLTAQIDCDDGDPAIAPGMVEICGDAIDQNCAGGADEGCSCDAIGASRDCGSGRCAGVQICTDSGWGRCNPEVLPAREECGPSGGGDGVDDDCNGVPDDGCMAFDAGSDLGVGEVCGADADCASGNCECEDFECRSRVCADSDCLCGYGTSGSCSEGIVDGPDPEDCSGDSLCSGLGDCSP